MPELQDQIQFRDICFLKTSITSCFFLVLMIFKVYLAENKAKYLFFFFSDFFNTGSLQLYNYNYIIISLIHILYNMQFLNWHSKYKNYMTVLIPETFCIHFFLQYNPLYNR